MQVESHSHGHQVQAAQWGVKHPSSLRRTRSIRQAQWECKGTSGPTLDKNLDNPSRGLIGGAVTTNVHVLVLVVPFLCSYKTPLHHESVTCG